MIHQVVTPSVGESITEVSILKWHHKDGEQVRAGKVLLEIESDKATVEVVASHSGLLKILKKPGERLAIGALIATLDDALRADAVTEGVVVSESAVAATNIAQTEVSLSPAVRRIVEEKGLQTSHLTGTGKGGRLTKGDVLSAPVQIIDQLIDQPGDRRVPMTMMRARIAERLVQAQHTAAILTTFNEADLSKVIALRNQHKESFKARHTVSLSFMSFFTRACIEALKRVPEVNASIEGREIIYHDYFDIGIAVGTERGLVVPVVREADKLLLPELEKKINELALKARDQKLTIAELSGGTFTLSNGGVYGSLLSTPILNPPQSGILGMHKIQERPVALNGKVEIRPMMYLAFSYDHRLIDGKGAVAFLIHVKDFIENPETLKLEF
jgi:2-oxoglutarate dehydrogenase E2 component (dihydrolipoamide succinyltransferase)